MPLAQKLMLGALALNVLILVPVISSLLTTDPSSPNPFGPETAARLILTAIYASIAITSVMLMGLHFRQYDWAIPMTVALFAVQIIYKLITVPLVGLDNPVVIANVGVVLVQALVLAFWARSTFQAS